MRVYGISDNGAPTEWFPSKEARDTEGRRRFAQFVEQRKRELIEQSGKTQSPVIDEALMDPEARRWASRRVMGRWVDIAEPPLDENGQRPEVWRRMNEQTAAEAAEAEAKNSGAQ